MNVTVVLQCAPNELSRCALPGPNARTFQVEGSVRRTSEKVLDEIQPPRSEELCHLAHRRQKQTLYLCKCEVFIMGIAA